MWNVPLRKSEIGIYQIDTNSSDGCWENHQGPLPVRNLFLGHHTKGPVDWVDQHQRLITDESEFHLEFKLPPCVVSDKNKVFLTCQMCSHDDGYSRITIFLNDKFLVGNIPVKNENSMLARKGAKSGRTVIESEIKIDSLHLNYTEKTNKITVYLLKGFSPVLLDWFKITAMIPEDYNE